MEHVLFKNANNVAWTRYHRENHTKAHLMYSDFSLIEEFGTEEMVSILEKTLDYLTDDGVCLFVSNDEHLNDIKDMMHEILTEDNYIGSIKVLDKGLSSDSSFLLKNYYHVLMYAKNKTLLENSERTFLQQSDSVLNLLTLVEESKKEHKRDFEKIINDVKTWVKNEKKYSLKQFQHYDRNGIYRLQDLRSKRKGGYSYNIVAPRRVKPYMPVNGWVITEEQMNKHIKNKHIIYSKDNRGTPSLYLKEYLKDYVDEILHASHITNSTQSNEDFEGMSGNHSLKVRDTNFVQLLLSSILRDIENPVILDPFDVSGDLMNAAILLNDREQKNPIKCYSRAESILAYESTLDPRIDALITGEWANWTSKSESKDTLEIV